MNNFNILFNMDNDWIESGDSIPVPPYTSDFSIITMLKGLGYLNENATETGIRIVKVNDNRIELFEHDLNELLFVLIRG